MSDLHDNETLEAAIKTGDPLKIYYANAQHRLLTAEEERVLGRRIQSGDHEACGTLITHNLRLVIAIARRYGWSDLPLADLIQAGNLGLMRATRRFDPERGIRFSTYAHFWIRQRILGELAQHSPIKLSREMYGDIRAVAKAERKLFMRLERQPTDKEIAEQLGISAKRVKTVRDQFLVHSMDAETAEDQTLHDTIATENTEPDPLKKRDQDRLVQRMLGVLVSHQRMRPKQARLFLTIIERVYGLNGHSPMSVPEIAAELGITFGKVNELHRKAIALMQREVHMIAPEGMP